MAKPEQKVKERRARTHEMVTKLATERRDMWILYCRVAGLEPFTAGKPTPELLQEFCQILVDYIATGHFVLYERIINGVERRVQVAELAQRLYPRIAQTTQAALDFNDRYDTEEHCKNLEDLNRDLSRLGEELAVRIEHEDKLIQVLSL